MCRAQRTRLTSIGTSTISAITTPIETMPSVEPATEPSGSVVVGVICCNWESAGDPEAEELAILELEVTSTHNVVNTTTARSISLGAKFRCTRAVYHGVVWQFSPAWCDTEAYAV